MQIQFWKTLTRYYLPHMAHVRPFWTILEMCWLLSYRFGVSISLRSGLRFWKVYFLSGRGMERVQIQFWICRSCGCRLGRRFGPYWVYLRPSLAMLGHFGPCWHHIGLTLSHFGLFWELFCPCKAFARNTVNTSKKYTFWSRC